LILSHFVLQYGSVIFEKEGHMMASNAVVRARIDEHLKEEAEAVLASIGLTVSDAFRMMMVRIAREKKLPFEPLVPNKETIEAMKAARRGEFEWEGPVNKLLEHLNADR
jgi:DNA-damage-inducible protein J